MAVRVVIQQKGRASRKIDLLFLREWVENERVYFGEPGEAWEWQNYSGGLDLRERLVVLYDEKGYGRGVGMIVHKDYSIELTLSVPPTSWDIDLFYRLIASLCKMFDRKTFLHEGKKCTVEKLENLKESTTVYMQRYVKKYLTADYTVFGCMYPIEIEQEFIDSIREVSEEEALRMYSEYLHEKQNLDCKYVYAKLFRNLMSGKMIARHMICKDVDLIFPIEKREPFGCSQEIVSQISHWSVDVVEYGKEGINCLLACPFEQFCSIVGIEKFPQFDRSHVLFRIDDEMLQFVRERMGECNE